MRTGHSHRDSPELRVAAIECRPASDTEERLRRLVTILLNHASFTASQAGGLQVTYPHFCTSHYVNAASAGIGLVARMVSGAGGL